jgi:RNA polymerase sigma-70 factor (sigma-E family)
MRGDDQAEFTSWARAHQARLLRTAYLLCADLGHAEDLTQDALVAVARRWKRLRDGEPYAYARRSLINANISRWRRHRPGLILVDAVEDRAHPPTGDPERRLVLAEALGRLAPRQRAVLVLRYYDDLTERQTAELLGLSIGTVKSYAHAALARLRESAPELAEFIGEASS